MAYPRSCHLLTRRPLLAASLPVRAGPAALHAAVPHRRTWEVHGHASAPKPPTAAGPLGSHDGYANSVTNGCRPSRATGSTPTNNLCVTSTGDGRARLAPGPRAREWDLEAAEPRRGGRARGTFAAWTNDGRVPGRRSAAARGERLRITFVNPSPILTRSTSTASIRPRSTGPRIGAGQIQPAAHGLRVRAPPAGLHLTTATRPLAEHIAKGSTERPSSIPQQPRPEADEMVMVMNRFDTNSTDERNLRGQHVRLRATRTGRSPVKRGQLVRISS